MPTPTDFLDLTSLLTSEQKQIQASTRDFVTREIKPYIQKNYREEKFTESFPRKMGEMGLLGPTLSGYGLPAVDSISYGLMMKELERADSGVRSFASVQGALVMYPIHRFGSDEQKQTWLPRLGRGEAVGCFGLTESEGGSDPGAMKTRAEDRGDHYLLNGSKMWITSGSLAEVAIVWAKTENGVRGFLVPTNTSGFKAKVMHGKLSLRASVTSELFFDQVKLPKSALLPGTDGLRSALECLNQARYSIAWGVLGAAEACFEEAVAHVLERKVFSKTLSSFQLIQRKLALMCSEITKGQLVAFRLGQLKDEGKLHHSHVSLAKQANVSGALEVARMSRDVLGAHGIMDEYSTMRHLCNLETVYTYEGTNDIHLLVLGKEITGVAAFG